MKKFITLTGVFAALLLVPVSGAMADYQADNAAPVTAQTATNGDSTLTTNVLAAIELGAVADDTESTAPVQGGGSDASVTFDVSAALRSNLAWGVTSVETGAAQDEAAAQGAAVSATDAPLLSDVVNVDVANDAGARNINNSAQTYNEQFTQAVSWGDEAGTYTIDMTHSAAQTLPAAGS